MSSAAASNHNFAGRPAAATRVIVWVAVIIGSSLAEIIARVCFHAAPWWLGCVQVAILTLAGVAALVSQRFRVIGRFLLAVAALRLCWYLVAPKLGESDFVKQLTADASWGARLFVARSLPVAGAMLMAFTLVGKNIRRHGAFLRVGRLSAPVEAMPYLGVRHSFPWTVFGPALLGVFGIALPAFLYVTVRPNFAAAHRVWEAWPWILATAALNAANEEFQFRCVLLAHLRPVVPVAEAMLLTATLFGIGHFFGQPSGPIGVLMAGFAGWIWAKSMVETGGSGWAFLIHMVQDVVIFSFLAMAANS